MLVALFVLQAALFALEANRQKSGGDDDGALWRFVLAGVAAAVVIALLVWPGATVQVVLKLVAAWALISGGLGIVSAIRAMRARRQAWDWELTTSALWVIFGVMVLVKDLDNIPVVTAALSVYLTITGAVLLVAAWSLHVKNLDAKATTKTGDSAEHASIGAATKDSSADASAASDDVSAGSSPGSSTS